jgi:hypothetical protein
MFYPIKLKSPFNRYDWLALACVTLLGLMHLPLPFHTDQALFTVGALEFKQGAVLYRDFWDYKTPGIFLFYLIGGSLFGFTEVGIHTFELLYQLAFSAILILTLKPYFQFPAIASFTPVFTVGLYYGVSTFYHLTEVEGLVGFPLFLCVWFAYKATLFPQSQKRWLLFSGLLGGVVLYFKFVFSPILAGLWLLTLGWLIRHQPKFWLKTLLNFSVYVGLGVFVMILPAFLYFAHFGLLSLLYQTYLGYPSRILKEISYGGLKEFKVGFSWFLSHFAPAIGLGIIGVYAKLSKRLDFLTLSFLIWFSLGFGLVIFQKTGWWQYYYLITLVPIGLLAAKGAEILWIAICDHTPPGRDRLKPMILVSSLILLFGATFDKLGDFAYLLIREQFALTPATRTRFQYEINPEYRGEDEEIAFLANPNSLPGKIYVIGHPLKYLRSGRMQAIPHQGMAPLSFLHDQWTLIRQQLEQARPPYVYIKSSYAKFVTSEVFQLLDRDYTKQPTAYGTWYVLKQPDWTNP